MLSRLPRFARDVSGAVAPLFAVGLTVFIGVGALAWDVSRGYALRAELDAAVDAAALAGATQLDGKEDAVERATSAAQGALVQNSNRLADTFQANTVGVGDTIQFLTNLTEARTGTPGDDGVALTTSDGEARFIEITLAPRPMSLILGRLFGMNGFNARAHAVAGYGSAICKVPPLFVCNPDESMTIDLFKAHAGKGVVLNGKGPSGDFSPGNFGFLQVGDKLDALKQAMGRSPPLTECYGQSVETKTGDPTSVLPWFNTRFDIYSNNQVAAEKNSPYFAPAEITITGMSKNSGGSNDACKPNYPGSPAKQFDGNATGLSVIPLPRDKCAYSKTPTGANQTATCSGSTGWLGTGDWDRANYFSIVHNASAYATAPVTGEEWGDFYDYPGADPKPTYPTRYQVYLWEKANKANAAIWRTSNFANPNTKLNQDGDWATRQCGTTDAVTGVPDRRTISAIVLNCQGMKGGKVKSADIVGAVDLFLTEPAAVNGNGTIYGEVISSTSDTSEVGKETMFYSVRLYE